MLYPKPWIEDNFVHVIALNWLKIFEDFLLITEVIKKVPYLNSKMNAKFLSKNTHFADFLYITPGFEVIFGIRMKLYHI